MPFQHDCAGRPIAASGPPRRRRWAGSRWRLPSVIGAVALPLLGWAGSAPAQQGATPVPPAARPDVELERLEPQPVPALPPRVDVPGVAPSRAPAGAEGIRFVLTGIAVEGSTVYAPDDLRPAWAELIGTEISLAELYQVLDRITAIYRDDGYILSRAILPPQTAENGAFRIAVIEGHVGDVVVEGDAGGARSLVERYLAPVAAARPLDLATLERALLLVNDVPGLTAIGVLRPAEAGAGAAQLVVSVERRPVDGFAVLDNYGSRYTGPWGLALGGGANAVTALGERTQAILFVGDPFDDQAELSGQISGRVLLGGSGLSFELLVSYGASDPGFVLEPLDVENRALLVRALLRYPVIRSRLLSAYAEGGFDVIDEESDALGEDLTRDRLRVVHLAGSVEVRDEVRGASEIRFGLRQGLGILGASERGEAGLSRSDGDPEFTLVQAEATRLQGLPWNLTGLVRVGGQYAFDPLLSFEDYRIGRLRFARGYPPTELAGDHGIGVTAELQYNGATDLDWLPGYQVYGFYDFGQVWNRGSGGVPGASAALQSAGLGGRVELAEHLQVQLELAWPLNRAVSTRDDPGDRSPAVLFRTTARF